MQIKWFGKACGKLNPPINSINFLVKLDHNWISWAKLDLEFISIIMLKHCGNYAAVLINYASFLHQKCFSDLPKDVYYRSQNTNNQKHWYTPY